MKVGDLIAELLKYDPRIPVAVTIDPMVDSAVPVTAISIFELAYANNTDDGDWLVSHGDEINDDDLTEHVVIA